MGKPGHPAASAASAAAAAMASKPTQPPPKRRPGRPPSYIFDKPDAELSDLERRLKLSVIKRRLRQNRSYHRRKAASSGQAATEAQQARHGHPHPQPSQDSLQPNQEPLPPNQEPLQPNQESLQPLQPSQLQQPTVQYPHAPTLDLSFAAPPILASAAADAPVPGQVAPADPTAVQSPSPFAAGEALAAIASSWTTPAPAAHGGMDAIGAVESHMRLRNEQNEKQEPEFANPLPHIATHQPQLLQQQQQLQNSQTQNLAPPFGVVTSTASHYFPATPTAADPTSEFPAEDADPDSLISEFLDFETSQSILRSSSSIMRLSSGALSASLASLPPATRAGAHALSFFPAAFDACAAAALLGRNVNALAPLIQHNLLVVSDADGAALPGHPRFSVNPAVKHVLPGIRAQDELRRRQRERARRRARLVTQKEMYESRVEKSSDTAASAAGSRASASSSESLVEEAIAAALQFTSAAITAPSLSASDTAFGGGAVGKRKLQDFQTSMRPDGQNQDPEHQNQDADAMADDEEDQSRPPSYSVLRARFVAHYGQVLSSLSNNPHINRNGTERLRAMRTFDAERKNVLHAIRLSEAIGSDVHVDFLRKGAPVMRYCTDAKTRLSFFQNAIAGAVDIAAECSAPPLDLYAASSAPQAAEAETVLPGHPMAEPHSWMAAVDSRAPAGAGPAGDMSAHLASGGADSSLHPDMTENGFGSLGTGSGDSRSLPVESEVAASTPVELERTSMAWLREFGAGYCPELCAQAAEDAERTLSQAGSDCRLWRNQARVYLALGEAYVDMLDMENAEAPLMKARDLLDARSRRSECNLEAVSLALPNLLLAEIRACKGDVMEAKRLLYYALSTLSQAGLSESTFTVNAMNTLVGVHIKSGNYDEAMWTCTKMVDVLANMGGGSYRGMPIYADALGTLATVHLNLQQPNEAERLFCEALEVIYGWLGRDGWHSNAPFEHCQDLDIWLMEGLARACRDQGKVVQADAHIADAEAKRFERGLGDGGASPTASSSSEAQQANHGRKLPQEGPDRTTGPSVSGFLAELDGVGGLLGSQSSLDSPGLGLVTEFDSFGTGLAGGRAGHGAGPGGDIDMDAYFSNPGMMDLKSGFPQKGTPLPSVSRTRVSVDKNRPYPRHIY